MWFQSGPSRIRRALHWLPRLARSLEREGARSLARRKLAQFAAMLAERARLRHFRSQPWTGDDRPVFLLISHRFGGGTERHLGDLAHGLTNEGIRVVIVRPGQHGHVLWEERDNGGDALWLRETEGNQVSILQMLTNIGPSHAHVHHSLGLPQALFDALAERGVSFDWTIHDYHSICPRINLIGVGGRYCGEPDEAGCNRCLAHLGDDCGRPVQSSIAIWREKNAARLGAARRVFVPSEDVSRRLSRYFPDIELTLRPHEESLSLRLPLARPLRSDEAIRIAVIGTLVAVKGSQRLLACATDARIRGLPLEFHLIGSSDRNAALRRLRNVHITGRYREDEVFDLLASAKPHLAFLPSECPESHMYTLSVAMAAGLFVVCFDLGAQALRVRSWGWGRPIAIEFSPGQINDELLAAAHSLSGAGRPPRAPSPAYYPDTLTSYYEFSDGDARLLGRSRSCESSASPSRPIAISRRGHARLH